MLSIRGPRRWAITLASTSSPSTDGFPTLTSLPSLNSSTRPILIDESGSASRRSTRIRSPGATRYCLPPLTMTADAKESGLGTARDCTKRPRRALPDQDRGHHYNRQHEHRVRGDHPRIQAPRQGRATPADQEREPQDHRRDHERNPEKPERAAEVVRRRRDEQSREEPAVGKPRQDSARVEPLV